jgi:hypothetical protein
LGKEYIKKKQLGAKFCLGNQFVCKINPGLGLLARKVQKLAFVEI